MNALYWQTALLLAGAYMSGAIVACILRKLFGSSRRRAQYHANRGVATGPAAAAAGAAPTSGYQPQNVSRYVGKPTKNPLAPAAPASGVAPLTAAAASAAAAVAAAAVSAASAEKNDGELASASAPVSALTSPAPAPAPQLIEPAPMRVPMSGSTISMPERSLSSEIASSQNAARFERSLSGPAAQEPGGVDTAKSALSTTTSIAAAVAAAAVVSTAANAAAAVSGSAQNVDAAQDAIEDVAASGAAPHSAGGNIVVAPITNNSDQRGDGAIQAVLSGQGRESAAGAAQAAGTDDLQEISRIDATIADVLHEAGVTQFSQIAAWSASEVEQVNTHLGVRGRVQKENWIEQAQILAAGGKTIYAHARGQAAAGERELAAMPAPSPASGPASSHEISNTGRAQTASAQTAASVAAAAAAAAAVTATATKLAAPASQSAGSPPETNLREPALSPANDGAAPAPAIVSSVAATTTLSAITSGEQPEGEAMSGQQSGQSWSERAQQRSAQERERRDARGSRAAREPRSIRDGRGDIGSMRSVRSQALRSGAAQSGAAGTAAQGGAKVVSSVPDDLKRVRGVGVLIERKLNSLGVTHYEQIANWSAEQVADISHKLDFKGRIERENWVEQARILAAGGYTEFSSRVDRGEVDSSKNRD